ncbi:DUF4123 domain-containing protein [Pseudomonas sp. St29]|uniref:DUF4123 domain-containing protein n=1 Tax=Pseudomonas sp. St29 TaxID=1500687 RepID=UPI0005FC470A|nr:DUF4123 domain-containing protein [Pseudomonas sp. St29]BAQ82032.1 uncharacterized protein PST29_4143 [Pseudomonas sp. St29]
MSTWLSEFLKRPVTAEPWSHAGKRQVYCLVDNVRQPRVLEQLYQLTGVSHIEQVFQGTAFAELNQVSPLWLHVDVQSPALSEVARLCQARRSGVLLTSNTDPSKALQHARRLLQMHSPTHGAALARFYDPAFWSALALTTASPFLFGPWHSVYTPPAHPDDRMWRVWEQAEVVSEVSHDVGYPLRLPDSTLPAADEIRWWYWVRAYQAETAGSLADEQLPRVLANLRLLVEHGVDEGRHLGPLLPHLSQRSLREHPRLMEVLRSELPAFEKIQRLEI